MCQCQRLAVPRDVKVGRADSPSPPWGPNARLPTRRHVQLNIYGPCTRKGNPSSYADSNSNRRFGHRCQVRGRQVRVHRVRRVTKVGKVHRRRARAHPRSSTHSTHYSSGLGSLSRYGNTRLPNHMSGTSRRHRQAFTLLRPCRTRGWTRRRKTRGRGKRRRPTCTRGYNGGTHSVLLPHNANRSRSRNNRFLLSRKSVVTQVSLGMYRYM